MNFKSIFPFTSVISNKAEHWWTKDSKNGFLWVLYYLHPAKSRSSPPEVFLKKVFWKYTVNLQENTHAEVWFQKSCFQITFRHGCSPVNLLHIFRTSFPKNTSGWPLMKAVYQLRGTVKYVLLYFAFFVYVCWVVFWKKLLLMPAKIK